jgi:hypothetical protein
MLKDIYGRLLPILIRPETCSIFNQKLKLKRELKISSNGINNIIKPNV